jgi:hypothetical protein
MNGIQIVDRGRGPQLSTNRITVQDLVPYFQRQWTYAQIREVIPTLSVEEIAVIEQYIQLHREEVAEQDRRIRDRAAARQKPAHIEASERRGRLERLESAREMIRRHQQEGNGAHSSS